MMLKFWCVLVLLAVTKYSPIAVAQANANEAAFEAAFNRGVNLQQQRHFQEAIQHYERALALLPTAPNAPDSDNLLNNLADMYAGHHGRQPERAEELYQGALELRIKRYGLKNRSTMRTLGSLALLSTTRQNWEEATRRYQRLLDLQRQVFPAPSAEVAETLSQLGGIALAQSRYEKAHSLLSESLTMFETALGRGDSRLLSTLIPLAIVESDLGRRREAERLLARVLAAAQKTPDGQARHYWLSMTYMTRAELARAAGRFREAESAYRAALEIDKGSPDLVASAASLSLDLGGLYAQMGLHAKAVAAYQESSELARQSGTNSPNYEMLLALNWGSLASDREQYAEAEELLQKARKLSTDLYGSESLKTIRVSNNLGLLYLRMQRFADATQVFLQAKQTLASVGGAQHPLLGHVYVSLGAAQLGGGDDREARECWNKALEIFRGGSGSDGELIDVLARLARLDVESGRLTEAVALLNESRRTARRYVSQELPDLSPPEQLQFLSKHDGWHLTNALSTAAANADLPAMRESAAEWILNSKGVAQEALSQRVGEWRTVTDPRAAKHLEELQSMRAQLVALRGKAAQTAEVSAPLASRIEAIAARESLLEAELAEASGLALRADPWVGLEEVRRAIPRGEVLVELAKTQLFNVSRDRDRNYIAPSHYLAWVVPAPDDGQVQMLDLGPAKAIEDAVAQVRSAFEAAPAAIGSEGHQSAERAVRGPLAALSRLVLGPLLPHLGGAERIALSPDSSLWLVPWCALVLPDGRYAIEQYDVRHLISGRDLVNVAKTLPTSRPVIFADPDYNLSPVEVLAATRQVLRKTVPTAVAEPLPLKLHVDRLPGTADEARAIAPALEQLAHAAPRVYTGRWALEGVIKAVRQPRVVVTSTHGFFLPDQVVLQKQQMTAGETRGPALDQHGQQIAHPLLRCGLLLAGCNRAGQGQVDDGVLTGLEIAGMDLRGTELVVLSACQTGLGDLHRGEGVAGLRQAFQLAGAQAVIATLWQIDDTETVSLMTELFSGLAAGQAKSAALRAAQFRRIAAHRVSYGAAHPYYWAAFTLTGRG